MFLFAIKQTTSSILSNNSLKTIRSRSYTARSISFRLNMCNFEQKYKFFLSKFFFQIKNSVNWQYSFIQLPNIMERINFHFKYHKKPILEQKTLPWNLKIGLWNLGVPMDKGVAHLSIRFLFSKMSFGAITHGVQALFKR